MGYDVPMDISMDSSRFAAHYQYDGFAFEKLEDYFERLFGAGGGEQDNKFKSQLPAGVHHEEFDKYDLDYDVEYATALDNSCHPELEKILSMPKPPAKTQVRFYTEKELYAKVRTGELYQPASTGTGNWIPPLEHR